MRNVDIAIIGAGTARMAAYRAARKHTDRLALIEGGPYGTTCARVGCMPSKLLIAAAESAEAVENQAELKPLGASSKMYVELAFLTWLRDMGRDTATRWLDENFVTIGERSTVDLREMFQGIGAQHQG